MASMESRRPARGILILVVLGIAILGSGAAIIALTGRASPRAFEEGEGERPGKLLRAKEAFVNREFARAEELLRRLPEDREARLLLARVLLERGRLGESHDIFVRGVKDDPASVEAARGLAGVYRGLGQHELAVATLAYVARERKDDPRLWKKLGLAQREAGDALGALPSIQQSLALDGGQEDLSTLLSELASSDLAKPGVSPGMDPHSPRPVDPRKLVWRPELPIRPATSRSPEVESDERRGPGPRLSADRPESSAAEVRDHVCPAGANGWRTWVEALRHTPAAASGARQTTGLGATMQAVS